MDDLISRQAAIDAFYLQSDDDGWWTGTAQDVEELLKGLPSEQPEIIRCKNCTWWSNDEYRKCSSPNYDNVHVTPAGFYCGWAERRTDG